MSPSLNRDFNNYHSVLVNVFLHAMVLMKLSKAPQQIFIVQVHLLSKHVMAIVCEIKSGRQQMKLHFKPS